jgi:hypothetical protein
MSEITLVSYGVDTLILNIRYADNKGQPIKQELVGELAHTLRNKMPQASSDLAWDMV